MVKKADKSPLYFIILLVLADLVLFVYDTYEVVAGKADSSRHIPFFAAIVLGAAIVTAVVVWQRHVRGKSGLPLPKGASRANSTLRRY